MTRQVVTIPTRDGQCPATLYTPANASGPLPAVIFFMDGLAIRQSLFDMAQQLADTGYVVLLPDLYYRSGPYEPMVPAEIFANPDGIKHLMGFINTLNRDTKVSDTGAFIDFLSKRPEVKPGKIGCTGYCMGGNIAVTAAGAYPDVFGVAASFHGGGLATDAPDSPHLFVKGVKGTIYVGGADQDSHFDEAQKERLEKALTDAGVTHEVEIYAGALHGYAVPDHPAYNAEADQRHKAVLARLLAAKLS